MKYVVCFIKGTYGTGFCHFINCHDGFYTTFMSHQRDIEVSGGAFHIDNDLNIYTYNDEYICEELVDCTIAVKPRTIDNELYAHTMLKNYKSLLDNKKIKLIFILPTDEIVSHIKDRKICNKGEFSQEASLVTNVINFKKTIKKISSMYTINDDFFCLKIEDVFSWVNSKESYPKNYLKLCQFLNTDPRPTFKLDLKRIFYNTKYQGKEV
jgi:hypothetical protein